ncbi:MAG: hypothetical protein ACKOHJ_06800 [Vulcanococcus sp.]|jgi:hypothetical protein
MASPKDAASLVLLCLYCFVSLRLMLTWRTQRGVRRQREAVISRLPQSDQSSADRRAA